MGGACTATSASALPWRLTAPMRCRSSVTSCGTIPVTLIGRAGVEVLTGTDAGVSHWTVAVMGLLPMAGKSQV